MASSSGEHKIIFEFQMDTFNTYSLIFMKRLIFELHSPLKAVLFVILFTSDTLGKFENLQVKCDRFSLSLT